MLDRQVPAKLYIKDILFFLFLSFLELITTSSTHGAEGVLGSEGVMGAEEDKGDAIYLMLDG